MLVCSFSSWQVQKLKSAQNFTLDGTIYMWCKIVDHENENFGGSAHSLKEETSDAFRSVLSKQPSKSDGG